MVKPTMRERFKVIPGLLIGVLFLVVLLIKRVLGMKMEGGI